MIRLTRCNRPDHAREYFELHLATGDSPDHPAAPGITLKPAWIGPALPEVKIAPFQPPTARQLVRLGRGLHPEENKRLAPAKNRKRAYYDLTISSPKTISLAALLEPNHPVAKTVMQAHMGAVEAVARSAGRMIEPQNSRGAATDKWLGVIFHHTHTRENDPHLHSHLILPNVMLNRDGQWRAMQVVISGPNRLKLGLIYGHQLATRLRRVGFGPEIVMRATGVPEIRSLQPMARMYSKARGAVLDAEKVAESERATQGGEKTVRQQGSQPRVFPPEFYGDAKLGRRRRLADRMRKAKPKGADDPVKLTHEAERWKAQLSNQDHAWLTMLLDGLDPINPRRPAPVIPGPTPTARVIVQAASMQIPEGAKTTGPVIFRGAVVLSAGRHQWDELLKETREKMARRRKALVRIKAQIEADSIAIAQAEIQGLPPACASGPMFSTVSSEKTTPGMEGTASSAPTSTSAMQSPERVSAPTPPSKSNGGRRGR